ncbi:PTS sugar transporter subunit IIB [Enterococcus dongliensis]|uniref:PTS sugar transporter subunit IIB n=1 Tax=Enterococcus dongliensis TaxID=2559925 RepID=A0AAP5KQB2_9ENTE|nr:PTS sugar transporter subunit IIB [Enterococcus dongliensis]MDT2596307.1 PTS sugar transporter subunit IIB [Enterococcus dongliensis]MDT2604348.1 PTS sugar transporter subunit IIB [Enterococcus dongliensis]MDT2612950.1 PTS sugar transporter subunit IIB [Enterococcus dongliensis]MDT2635216.1 PTS sugar transporter subunit IIB [Enterococcus dongliensis]MDT2637502.1 PTS sugar transporter subunit IIB [Enterococcus dongliensis]
MKRIMLVCAAGMSTSLLVTKMEKAAEAEGVESEIFAVSASEADTKLEDTSKPVDVLLLGPQVRFMKNQFETKLADQGIPVAVIDMKDYGMMNGEAVLTTALNLMK